MAVSHLGFPRVLRVFALFAKSLLHTLTLMNKRRLRLTAPDRTVNSWLWELDNWCAPSHNLHPPTSPNNGELLRSPAILFIDFHTIHTRHITVNASIVLHSCLGRLGKTQNINSKASHTKFHTRWITLS